MWRFRPEFRFAFSRKILTKEQLNGLASDIAQSTLETCPLRRERTVEFAWLSSLSKTTLLQTAMVPIEEEDIHLENIHPWIIPA